MFKLLLVAFLYVSAASANEDAAALKPEVGDHGSKIVPGLKELNNKWLAPMYGPATNPWYYVQAYNRYDVSAIAGSRQAEWDLFKAIDYRLCDSNQIETIKKTVAAADVDWHRQGAKWRTVGTPYKVQAVILGLADKHAKFCQDEYEKKAIALATSGISGEAKKFAGALIKAASEKCSPNEIVWTDLRPSTKKGQLYYTCVRGNPEIFSQVLASQSGSSSFDREAATKLVEQGKQSCQTVVDHFKSLFEMVHYDSEVVQERIPYGSEQFNAMWSGYETCKELVNHDSASLVESLVASSAN